MPGEIDQDSDLTQSCLAAIRDLQARVACLEAVVKVLEADRRGTLGFGG